MGVNKAATGPRAEGSSFRVPTGALRPLSRASTHVLSIANPVQYVSYTHVTGSANVVRGRGYPGTSIECVVLGVARGAGGIAVEPSADRSVHVW